MSRIYNNLKLNLEAVDFKTNVATTKNKLEFYHLLSSTTLEEDIKYATNQEEALVNQFCNLEVIARSRVGQETNSILKAGLGIKNIEEEKELFTRMFMRDYLSNVTNNDKLALKDNLNAGILFRDFASKELHNDNDFTKTILTLDGRYMPYMSDDVKNNISMMTLAINNDTTEDVESFQKTTSNLSKNPHIASLYLEKMKKNKGYRFNTAKIYHSIFKKDENGQYTTEVFKKQEQASWLQDEAFLLDIAKLDNGFIKYIVEGKISLNLNNSNQAKTLKK